MVPERVDGRPCLFDRLGAHRPSLTPLEWKVLQQQQPEFVGNGIHLAIRDVSVDAQRVEPEIDGRLEIAADALRGGVGRAAGSPGGSSPP